MKLYGIAIAIVPDKQNPQVMSVVCNPLSVSSENQEGFEVLNDLKFKMNFDSTKPKEFIDCFIKTVGVIDDVVQLQKQSCSQNGVEYRPVALRVGQDSRNPVNVNALYMRFFGERFSPPKTDQEIEELVFEANLAKREKHNNFRKNREIHNQLSPEMQEIYKQRYISKHAPRVLEYYKKLENDVSLSEIAFRKFQGDSQSISANFIEAKKKFAELLKQCVLAPGSYSPGAREYPKDFDIKNLEPDELDLEISTLQKSLDENPSNFDPHYKLIEIAREIGKSHGREVTDEIHSFWHVAPPGYANDREAQERCPQYSFFQWDTAYEKAFYEGFNKTYMGPHTRRLKLPMSASNPPFTDPTADMVRDQFEIIRGRRSEDGVFDRPDWRQRMASMSTPHSRINPAGGLSLGQE